MKMKIFAVIFAIAMICAGRANAQYSYYGGGSEEVDFSVSFSGGAVLFNDFTSPAASVRFGVDYSRFIGELEFSYLSINAAAENCYGGYDKNSLSTVTFGVNMGVKFLGGSSGYIVASIHTGYAIQEEWLFDNYYCCYESHHGRFRGKGYFGVGLSGAIKITSRFGLFGEARYQSLPIDGAGRNKWGSVF